MGTIKKFRHAERPRRGVSKHAIPLFLLFLTAAAPAPTDLASLRARLVQLGADEVNGERKAHDQAERLTALNAAEADLRARMGKNQASLTRLLAALQMYQRNPPPALLVSPRSAKDAVNAAILMRAITPELKRRAAAFAVESKTLNALRRQILVADGEFLATEKDVADRRDGIDALNEEKARLEGRQAASPTAGDAAADHARAISGSVDDLLRNFKNADATSGSASVGGRFKLQPPVQGALIRRFEDAGGGSARSHGWTWAAAPGALVLAPAAGRVNYAGPLKGWGVVLILSASGGYHLVLAGLDAVNARAGSDVAAGEPVGRVAKPAAPDKRKSPATSDVYLEVRQGTTPVDPARFLGGDGQGHH